MENNTLAILSFIMITIGFVEGCTITKFFQDQRVKEVENKLQKAIEDKFTADLRIDELEQKLEKEKQTKQDLVNQLSCLVNKHSYLPPPDRPLKRSRYCSEGSCDETFVCPTSPVAE
jgi:hypothetical protein